MVPAYCLQYLIVYFIIDLLTEIKRYWTYCIILEHSFTSYTV